MIIVTAEYPFSSPASFSKPFNSYAKASPVKRSEKGYGDENAVYRFQSVFSSTRKRKAGVFKFFRFDERFDQLRFRNELVWTAGLTVEIRLCFLISTA